jgi:hypothetical protein
MSAVRCKIVICEAIVRNFLDQISDPDNDVGKGVYSSEFMMNDVVDILDKTAKAVNEKVYSVLVGE